jgi:hypothetical protein
MKLFIMFLFEKNGRDDISPNYSIERSCQLLGTCFAKVDWLEEKSSFFVLV